MIIPKCEFIFYRVTTLRRWEILTRTWNNILWVCLAHAQKLHELPDEYLADALPITKKIALALGCEDYNILQVKFRVPFNRDIMKKPVETNWSFWLLTNRTTEGSRSKKSTMFISMLFRNRMRNKGWLLGGLLRSLGWMNWGSCMRSWRPSYDRHRLVLNSFLLLAYLFSLTILWSQFITTGSGISLPAASDNGKK